MAQSRILLTATALLILMGAGFAHAQDANEILTQVAKRSRERQAALASYTSDRTYKIEYHGTGGEHAGQMNVHAEYRAPGVKHFTVISESGSRGFCDKVLRRLIDSEEESSKNENQIQMMLSPQLYNAQLVGQETVNGVNAWVLDVTPKEPSKFTYSGRVWVSIEDQAVMRVVGHPARNPSWLVNRTDFDSEYEHVGAFWLMGKNTTVSHVRMGGQATLTIDYGKYTVDAVPEKLQASRVTTDAR